MVLDEVKGVISRLETLHQQLLSVSEQVTSDQLEDSFPVFVPLAEIVDQEKEFDCIHSYVLWLEHICSLKYVVIVSIFLAHLEHLSKTKKTQAQADVHN